MLERMGNGKTWPVSAGGPGAGGADGVRASGRVRVAVGGDQVDRGEARDDAARRCGSGFARPRSTAARGRAEDGRAERVKELERENRELRRANEILKAASVFFARELDRTAEAMIAFIDEHRAVFGVEPICRVLQVAPSTYYAARDRAARRRRGRCATGSCWPTSPRARRPRRAYGARKVWAQLCARASAWPLHRRAADAPRASTARPGQGACARPIPDDTRSARPIWSSGTSPPPRPTGCGWPTSSATRRSRTVRW